MNYCVKFQVKGIFGNILPDYYTWYDKHPCWARNKLLNWNIDSFVIMVIWNHLHIFDNRRVLVLHSYRRCELASSTYLSTLGQVNIDLRRFKLLHNHDNIQREWMPMPGLYYMYAVVLSNDFNDFLKCTIPYTAHSIPLNSSEHCILYAQPQWKTPDDAQALNKHRLNFSH